MTRYTVNGGVRIAYEVAGNGPALVLLHANPFDRRLFLYQVAAYAPHYRTIAIDLRGYGESDKPATAFTLGDLTGDVLAVLDAERVRRALILGVSVGSKLALAIGLERPERVDGLVLVGGAARGSASTAARIAGYLSDDPVAYRRAHMRELVSPAFGQSALGAWLLDTIVDTSPPIVGACIAQIFRAVDDDLGERLPELRAPTLLVNGERDNALPASRDALLRIRGARHAIVAGAGHACNLEDPAAFARIVTPFLRDHARTEEPVENPRKTRPKQGS